MRRFLLTIGILMILGGLLVINQGTDVIRPLAESFGLVSHVRGEDALIAPTLFTVPPSNFTFLSAELKGGVQVSGSVDVGAGAEIAFYVMNEANFSNWLAGRPSSIVLAKPFTSFYNFTFTPNVGGTYYFVFDNQANSRREVVFTLNAAKDTVILSPVVQYLGIELLTVGVLLSAWGVRGGRRKRLEHEVTATTSWKCRFCGAENPISQTFCGKCERARE